MLCRTEAGNLTIKSDDSSGKVLRTTRIDGCTVGELKSKRKGHDHAFRLDLDASPLLGGKPKPTTLLRSMFATVC